MRRIRTKVLSAPKGRAKYCETCLCPRAVMMYGNRTQALQAAKAKNPKRADDVALCTNTDGGVHITKTPSIIVISEDSE